MTVLEAKVVDKDAMKIVIDARSSYINMQRSWFGFAKSIHAIDALGDRAYQQLGVNNFKEYAELEFPTLHYKTLRKYISIVEEWGDAIETRFKKDSDYRLPAYESCYALISKKEDIPKEEITKLKNAVLSNKMTWDSLREAMKAFAPVSDPVIDVVATDELQKSLIAELEQGGELEDTDFEESDFVTVDEFESEAEFEEEDDDIDSQKVEDETLASLLVRANYIIDNLPHQTDTLKVVTDEVVAFADRFDDLCDVVEKFLKKVEDSSK